jgi:glycosyltransferase involved in cell wall biosynthesis
MTASGRPIESGSAPGTPQVSVIVAAFNAAAHIEEACRSALAQTLADLEVIIVDDGSTDDTAAIVDRLSARDGRLRLIRQPNRGVAAARNAAIAASRGEFLAPLDADDVWDARKLEQQVARMRERGPATGLVYCWWISIDPTGRVLDRSPNWEVEGAALRQLLEINFTGNSSVPLFRRQAVADLGGYDASLHASGRQGCEDWDLAIRTAERSEVAVVRQVLVAYRRRTDGMSTSCDTMWQSQLSVTSTLAARHPQIPDAVFQRSRGQFCLYLAGVSFWAGDVAGAVRWTLRVRPIGLLWGVLPHLGRLVLRRIAGHPRAATSLVGFRFDDQALPEALIPYNTLYGSRWSGSSASRRTSPAGPQESRPLDRRS